MQLSSDMKEFIRLFTKYGVIYALVGGHAVNYYGYVRATQDMDLLVEPSAENSQRIMAALSEFGFGEAGVPQGIFERRGGAVHLGNEPNRIDILTSLKGVHNARIFSGIEVVEIDGISVDLISYDDLMLVKRRSDRPRDRADADELAKING